MSNSKKRRFSIDEDEHETFEEQASEDEGFEASHDDEDYDDDDYASAEIFEEDQEKLVDFLKYPRNKRTLTDYIEDTYKKYEEENVQRTIARKEYEHNSELQGATEFHKPGHIGPLMYQYLNMIGVESAFASGLQHTKASMTKTVQQRVDEINTLLRGVGGFNRQIKASFSRSANIYLEQEDPRNSHRERVVFTVNISDFELRYPLDESADSEFVDDGRTLRRLVWDEAVNTLSEIISNTGLKPKYVKNDKNTCALTMRQYMLGQGDSMPDEYFKFDLRHVNEGAKESLLVDYKKNLSEFDVKVSKMHKKMNSMFASRAKKSYLQNELRCLVNDKEFYIGTTADPAELDTGLVFSIYVNTMKDYTITKDKMQVIMTKFILAMSTIATDKSLDQQVNTVYQQKQAKATSVQDLSAKGGFGKPKVQKGKKRSA